MAGLVGIASAHAEPRPLLVLWESNGWGAPAGPQPYGLRLVIYDDGEVISSPDGIEMASDGAPHFLFSKKTPAEAIAAADSVKQQLAGLPKELRGAEPATDMGWTTIQVQDSVSGQPERYDAYGLPCQAPNRDFKTADKLDAIQRLSMNADFLKVCDALSLYDDADARPWAPSTM